MAIVLLASACGNRPPPKAERAVDAHLEQAHRHEKAHRYDLAEASYRQAIGAAQGPTERHRAQRALADALLFWGRYQDAQAALAQLVGARPADVASWHDLGIVRAELGDAAGAERALARAIDLAPSDPRSRIALAALLVNQRRYAEAERHYRQLLELELPDRLRRAVMRALELLAAENAKPAPAAPQ